MIYLIREYDGYLPDIAVSEDEDGARRLEQEHYTRCSYDEYVDAWRAWTAWRKEHQVHAHEAQ